MDKMPWMKEWKDKKIAVWRLHPHDIFGMFKLCEYTVDDHLGRYTASVEQWSKIIVAEENKTRRFLNYLKDNINEVIVTSEYIKEDNKLVQYYTVTLKDIFQVHEKKDRTKERVKRHRGEASPASIRRMENLKRVMEAYHPDKAGLQPFMARGAFTRIMIDSSREVSRTKKEEKEEKETQKILQYIEGLKSKSDWVREGGRYLLGLGNFLKARSWENSNKHPDSMAKDENNQDDDIDVLTIGGL